MTLQTLDQQQKAIRQLMEYAVPAEHMQAALALLDRYRADRIASNLLHAFYSYLPEGLDDGVRDLRLVSRRQGAFLLAAVTFHSTYLYLVTGDTAEFLGELATGIWDKEVLEFFELGDREKFLKKYGPPAKLPAHEPTHLDKGLCPVCAVADGEEHTLGCPVEVCPWCGGQLTSCNCRFEQLDRDHLIGDHEIEAFREKLAAKGRIPYDSARHRPAYPAADDEDTPLTGQQN